MMFIIIIIKVKDVHEFPKKSGILSELLADIFLKRCKKGFKRIWEDIELVY